MNRDAAAKFIGHSGAALTEVIAALFVASALIAGIAELTRRFAVTTLDVRSAGIEARTLGLVEQMFGELSRAEPGSLIITSDRLEARIGSATVFGRLTRDGDQQILHWEARGLARRAVVPAEARFERHQNGLFILAGAAGDPPLGLARLARDIPFDCRFDVVSQICQ